MASAWRRLAREPLLHFLLVGGAIFAVDRVLHHDRTPRADASERRLVVTPAVREELARGWSGEHGRSPTTPELDGLVARWIDDEILYREGRRRGLERDDPRVRARVASKMAFVLEAEVIVPEPTDAELRAWLAAHEEAFAEAERVDFVHVFVAGQDDAARARAQVLLSELRAGATPIRLGDTFSGGRHYRRRTIADLGRTFGEAFARGVQVQALGTWALHASRYGQHVVRIERHTRAAAADFASVRGDVRYDWIENRRAVETSRALAALRSRWEVVREP